MNASQNAIESTGFLENRGAVGKAVQGLGETVSGVADALYRRKAQEEVSNNRVKFAEAQSEFEQRISQETNEGTIDPEKIAEDYKAFVDKHSEGLSTYESRADFESQAAMLDKKITKLSAQGKALAAGEKAYANMSRVIDVRAQTLQRKPGEFQELLQQTMDDVNKDVALGVYSPKQAEKIKMAVGKELSKNALYGSAKRSPYQALRELDSGVYQDYLDADTARQMREHIASEMKGRADQQANLLMLKEKEPWEYLKKVGEAGGAKPLSFGEDVADSFRNRGRFVDTMNRKHGINLPFISDLESLQLVNRFNQMPAQDAVQMFQHISTSVPDKDKGRFARDVFQKEPALSAAIMISGDDPQTARNIVGGMSLLRNSGDGRGRAVKPPNEAEVQRLFDSTIGNAIEDPGARVAARAAIKADLTKRLFDKGQSDLDGFSKGDFEESAAAVMGPVVEMNGMSALSFRGKDGKFLDEDDIEDLVSALTDDKVMKVQGDVPRTLSGEPMNLKKSKGRLSLKSVGDGQYFLYRDGEPTFDNSRRPFVLDLKNFEKGHPKKKGWFGFGG